MNAHPSLSASGLVLLLPLVCLSLSSFCIQFFFFFFSLSADAGVCVEAYCMPLGHMDWHRRGEDKAFHFPGLLEESHEISLDDLPHTLLSRDSIRSTHSLRSLCLQKGDNKPKEKERTKEENERKKEAKREKKKSKEKRKKERMRERKEEVGMEKRKEDEEVVTQEMRRNRKQQRRKDDGQEVYIHLPSCIRDAHLSVYLCVQSCLYKSLHPHRVSCVSTAC